MSNTISTSLWTRYPVSNVSLWRDYTDILPGFGKQTLPFTHMWSSSLRNAFPVTLPVSCEHGRTHENIIWSSAVAQVQRNFWSKSRGDSNKWYDRTLLHGDCFLSLISCLNPTLNSIVQLKPPLCVTRVKCLIILFYARDLYWSYQGRLPKMIAKITFKYHIWSHAKGD